MSFFGRKHKTQVAQQSLLIEGLKREVEYLKSLVKDRDATVTFFELELSAIDKKCQKLKAKNKSLMEENKKNKV